MSRSHEKYLINTAPIFDPERGVRLRYAARKMGIDQIELGKRLGVSQPTISKMMKGKVRATHVKTGVFKTVLGRHFEYFLTGEGKEEYEKFRHVKIDAHGNVTASHKFSV